MRDPKRIDEITNTLNALWHKYPDLRFWQLLMAVNWDRRGDFFYIEDNRIETILKTALEEGF